MPNDPAYILYPIMPTGRVHIISGGSGAGKTTAMFQLLKAMQDKELFFGYPTQDLPVAYVTFDRDKFETEETMARVGLDSKSIPIVEARVTLPDPSVRVDMRFENYMIELMASLPRARVFILDGFMLFSPHGKFNDYLLMGEWLQRVRSFCKLHDITIIGIVHSPKSKEGARILDPRQMITGSVAGAGFTSCIIVVENSDPLSDEGKRRIYFLPRNAPAQVVEAKMDATGRLVRAEEDSDLGQYPAFLAFLLRQAGGSLVSAAYIRREMDEDVSPNTISRYLAKALEEGALKKISHGNYKVPEMADRK